MHHPPHPAVGRHRTGLTARSGRSRNPEPQRTGQPEAPRAGKGGFAGLLGTALRSGQAVEMRLR